jgi:hypothetical protein
LYLLKYVLPMLLSFLQGAQRLDKQVNRRCWFVKSTLRSKAQRTEPSTTAVHIPVELPQLRQICRETELLDVSTKEITNHYRSYRQPSEV